MKPRHRTILAQLLGQPTAPFREEAVVAAVDRWARRRGVAMSRDAAGNVLLRLLPRRRGPRWVFAAHMDHPGFVAVARRGRSLRAEFRGGVGREYFPGSRARFFAPDGDVLGSVVSASKSRNGPWLSCRVALDGEADVPAGSVGMWDLPPMRIRGRRLSSRACDDVVGVAAVLAALEEIASRGGAAVTGLLTRAEEAGFTGCLAACESGLLPADARIVAIETSQAMPSARLGGGVVVRVGDRVRTFDATLTAHVSAVAAGLAKRDRTFRFQRRLMPGGTCESTAYAVFGHTATGLCLPLGNYHNRHPAGRIAPEYVDTGDFASLVKLLVALASEPRAPAAADEALKKRLKRLFRDRRKYL